MKKALLFFLVIALVPCLLFAQRSSLSKIARKDLATNAYIQFLYGKDAFKSAVGQNLIRHGYKIEELQNTMAHLDHDTVAFDCVLDAVYYIGGGHNFMVEQLVALGIKMANAEQLINYIIQKHQIEDEIEQKLEEEEIEREKKKIDTTMVYSYVNEPPKFDGDLSAYISKNMQYPPDARKNGESGRVIAKFIVNQDGSLSNIQITRGVGKFCDEEVIRLISSMPKWIPRRQERIPVKVWYTLPVSFQIN